LNLTELGDALHALDKDEEAESVYRKATLVSSNEWRCWVRLGTFLECEPFRQLFPDNLRGQAFPSGQMPSQEVLDYRPLPEALKKSEASLAEASRCFDRAMALVQSTNQPQLAIDWANLVLKAFPNDETAKEILKNVRPN